MRLSLLACLAAGPRHPWKLKSCAEGGPPFSPAVMTCSRAAGSATAAGLCLHWSSPSQAEIHTAAALVRHLHMARVVRIGLHRILLGARRLDIKHRPHPHHHLPAQQASLIMHPLGNVATQVDEASQLVHITMN